MNKIVSNIAIQKQTNNETFKRVKHFADHYCGRFLCNYFYH